MRQEIDRDVIWTEVSSVMGALVLRQNTLNSYLSQPERKNEKRG